MVCFLHDSSVKFQKKNLTTVMLCFFYIRDAFFLLFFTVEISVLGISEVGNETLYAALNESVTIEWKIEDQANLTKKIWIWSKTSVTLVEMDKKGEITPNFVKHFKDRLQMNKNGSLTICGLLYTDSGRYEQRMRFSDKEEQVYLLDLIIVEKITNVNISLDSNITLNDRCNLTLSCTAEDGSNVSYSWTVPNNNPSFYSGANLHVSLPVTNEGMLITCKASNPISSKIYHFSTREVCGVPNKGKFNC
ncbi:SLAM family member 5-like [Protopterus annectens]|uniref:SLAM family member 5-like n=1 Tax=Protopterus annectens TaxID=7888 RepID=UPI001CFA67D5|nr:SLAM family member 5-like [Protopterus annectens]